MDIKKSLAFPCKGTLLSPQYSSSKSAARSPFPPSRCLRCSSRSSSRCSSSAPNHLEANWIFPLLTFGRIFLIVITCLLAWPGAGRTGPRFSPCPAGSRPTGPGRRTLRKGADSSFSRKKCVFLEIRTCFYFFYFVGKTGAAFTPIFLLPPGAPITNRFCDGDNATGFHWPRRFEYFSKKKTKKNVTIYFYYAFHDSLHSTR